LGALGAVVVLLLAGFTMLNTEVVWGYLLAAAAFEAWLGWRVAAAGRAPVTPNQPPYFFSGEEARLVGRYRFYYTWPGVAHQSCNVLSALGLTALVLAPWLTYKGAFLPAALAGLNLFPVAHFTRRLAPLMALRMRAYKGEREALTLLEAHDPAWKKILANKGQSVLDSPQTPGGTS